MAAERKSVPVVSVGMPVYNGESVIRTAIEAILAQTFTDFELIISDNASTDRTVQICEEYRARDPRIRLLRNKTNLGVINNFNRTLKEARGTYFKAMSSNDVVAPSFLETGLRVLESHSDIVLFYSQVDKIDATGTVVGHHDDGFDLRETDPIKRFTKLHRTITVNNPMYGLIRMSELKKTSFLRSVLSADMIAIAELSLLGQFVQHDEILMSRRLEESRGYTDADYARELSFCTGKPVRSRPFLIFWRLCWENTKIVTRTPIPFLQRIRLFWYLLKNWFWTRDKLMREVRLRVKYWFTSPIQQRKIVNDAPMISVGIPVYNGEQHIAQAIESVLEQTYVDFELIISDNASTDKTESICRAYAEKDPRIRYVRNASNKGVIFNINQLVKMSRGTYFKYSSCNDYVEPEFLADAIASLKSQKDAVLCYAKTTLVEADGSHIEEYDDKMHLSEDSPVERFQHLMGKLRLNNALEGLIRLDALRSTSFHGDYVAADIVAMGELALRGKFIELPQKLQYRRMDAESSSLLRTGQELQLFLLGQRNRYTRTMTHWRLNWQHLVGMFKSPIGPLAKMKLSWFLFKNLYWNRQVLIDELARAGVVMTQFASLEHLSQI